MISIVKGGTHVDGYIKEHLRLGGYAPSAARGAYDNEKGWTDYRIGEHIVFAHRTNDYRVDRFTDALHAHDYVEMILWVEGDVQYLSGSRGATAQEGSVVIIPPGRSHTTRLLRRGRYTRDVLYFSPAAFSPFGEEMLLSLLSAAAECFTVTLTGDELRAARGAIDRITAAVTSDGPLGGFAAYSGVTDLLVTVSSAFVRGASPTQAHRLPETVSEIRRYIERNYAAVSSIDALACAFYYSREHLSRVFRKYYNISPHDYLERCRIREAMRRLRAGERVADVCYGVGYRSMSVFLAAFRRITGCTPSAFRKREESGG